MGERRQQIFDRDLLHLVYGSCVGSPSCTGILETNSIRCPFPPFSAATLETRRPIGGARSGPISVRCLLRGRERGGVLFEWANSTEPVPRPRSPAPGSIGWICKVAFVNRKTSASDALRKSCSETLKLGDPLIDPFRPFPRKARPIVAGGNPIGRKLGEFCTDFLKRQPDPLREDNKGNTAKHRSWIAPMP